MVRSGYLSIAELKLIPELSMNPLCPRIIELFNEDGQNHVNFRMFVMTLSAFHASAPTEEKMKVAFDCYDVDGDGVISALDLYTILKMLVGDNLDEVKVKAIAHKTIEEAASDVDSGVLTYNDFSRSIGAEALQKDLCLKEINKPAWQMADD
jgi:serine/threonine-protein phosphatase 2B regulatory subunit